MVSGAQTLVVLAGLLGATGVAAGAFGAHGLRGSLSESLMRAFETGVQYQLLHAVALFGVAWLVNIGRSPLASAAGWTMVAGVLLFSGSLYALALGGPRWFGPVTPIGGLCLMVSWALVVAAALGADDSAVPL